MAYSYPVKVKAKVHFDFAQFEWAFKIAKTIKGKNCNKYWPCQAARKWHDSHATVPPNLPYKAGVAPEMNQNDLLSEDLNAQTHWEIAEAKASFPWLFCLSQSVNGAFNSHEPPYNSWLNIPTNMIAYRPQIRDCNGNDHFSDLNS